jgi:hypothetical protein
MSRLVLTAEQFSSLRDKLLQFEYESCAILYGRSVEIGGRLVRIIVRDSEIPPSDAYSVRTAARVQLRPEVVAMAGQRARKNNESVVFVHTHPFSFNAFSQTDDSGELELATFLKHRVPTARHAALLLTPEVSIARELGQYTPLRVMGVGRTLEFGETLSDPTPAVRYDRQIRALGLHGQRRLETIRVGIVGLGGTGSVVLQQLLHLGVMDFVLSDPDTIDETNLNRVVGATSSDLGDYKVDVAKRWGQRINAHLKIDAHRDNIINAETARSLADVDFVFCCTDSHGSRAVLNQVAYQYLVPVIDMGLVIVAAKNTISHIAGRVQLLAPGLACLTCSNLLDAEQVRRDMLTDFERRADPYIIGEAQPAPAVISLNSTVAGLAVTMFLNTAVALSGDARFLNYNAIAGTLRPVLATPLPTCIVCSARGALARGDEWPLAASRV